MADINVPTTLEIDPKALSDTVKTLNAFLDDGLDLKIAVDVRSTLHKLVALYHQALAVTGECRKEVPYAPIRPVIRSDGRLEWRCTHNPDHGA